MLEQQRLILAVKEKALADQRVDAVLMYGSFTQNRGDQYSDVEFYLFVKEAAFPGFDSKAWIAEVHPYHTHFLNEHGSEVAIFTTMIRGEFHLLPAGELAVIPSFAAAGYFPDLEAMNLVDRRGELARQLATLAGCEATIPCRENAEDAVNRLLNQVLFGTNLCKRGEWARSLECLHAAQRFYLQALRLLTGKTEHWINPFKELERELDPEQYRIFAGCTADLEPRRIREAYAELLKASSEVIPRLRQKFGTRDFSELLDAIRRYARD